MTLLGGRTRRTLSAFALMAATAAPFGGWVLSPAFAQATGYGPISPWDAAVKEIRAAARYSPDGTHHALLIALRELHDPALKPFFQSLVQGEHWSIQIDGILGLAELDPNKQVDPFLLSQLKGENDRSTAIAAAIGLDLVGPDQATAMLAWDDLPARDRVVLAAELVHRGGKPALDGITKLLDHRNDEVAGLAAFVVATVNNDPTPVETYRNRLATLSAKDRIAVFAALANAIGRFKLTGATSFLAETLKDPALPIEARTIGLAALLPLDPDAGYAAWKAAVESDSAQSSRVRLALLLLATDAKLPKGAALPLRKSSSELDPLLGRLADAIDAMASGGDASAAFRALVQTKHRPSLAAALEATKRLNTESRVATLQAFGDILERDSRRDLNTATVELAIAALTQLATTNPDAIAQRLVAAQAEYDVDDNLVDILLLSLLGANTKEAAQVAETARTKTSRRGASLILILKARHADKLDDATLQELGVVASGGGRVEPPLQVQAAWLYAKLSGKADQAIAAALRP